MFSQTRYMQKIIEADPCAVPSRPLPQPIFYLDSEDPLSYPGSGSVWTDLINSRTYNLVGASYNSTEKAIEINSFGQYFSGSSFSVDRTEGFTFMVVMNNNTWNSNGNPGFTRSSGFVIYNGATRRPWVRWVADVLRPNSGYQVELNKYQLQTFSMPINGCPKTAYYTDDILRHEGSVLTNFGTSNYTVQNLGFQVSINENVWGYYKAILIFDKGLTQSEVAYYSNLFKTKYGY